VKDACCFVEDKLMDKDFMRLGGCGLRVDGCVVV